MPDADEFPRPLLALDDEGLTALMVATKPLQPGDRSAFLALVAATLPPVLGAGSLHRAIAQAQAAFLRDARLGETRGAGPRHSRAGWIRRPGKRRA